MRRRSLLVKGMLGGALLLVGGAGALSFRRTRLLPLPSRGLRVLSLEEYSVLAAVADRLLPSRRPFPSPGQLDVAWAADQILSRVDPTALKETKELLGLFENALAGFVLGGRTAPFTRLPPEEQDRVLVEWQTSRVALRRTGFQALKALVHSAYFGQEATRAAVGYPGPPEGYFNPLAPEWQVDGVPESE